LIAQNLRIIALVAGFSFLAGCNFAPEPQGDPSSTPQATLSLSPSTTEPSLTPSVFVSPSPQIAAPTPTFTALPPSETPTPSETPGPYVHTIAEGDTLITIIQTYEYTDLSVINEIVRINENIPNPDTLPGIGATILIPRQTATSTPENSELTEIAQAGIPTAISVTLAVQTAIIQHSVVEGETIVGIAQQYATTLEVISQLNPDIPFFGCDFSVASGGPDCNPPLQVGQVVNVPAPTPTPTLSPTPSGSETPTPTPTYRAPLVISPPQGGIAMPAPVRLDWVSVGVLQANEFYLVQVRDTTTGAEYAQVTKNTSIWLPESMIPGDGQPHPMEWTVRIAYPNEADVYQPIGGAPEVNTFQWQSR
jgi:hypothetical protein